LLKEKQSSDPVDAAATLGISEKAAVSLICSMATGNRLRITEIRASDG
jgi:RNA 3'-terminal phosphate cyclase